MIICNEAVFNKTLVSSLRPRGPGRGHKRFVCKFAFQEGGVEVGQVRFDPDNVTFIGSEGGRQLENVTKDLDFGSHAPMLGSNIGLGS